MFYKCQDCIYNIIDALLSSKTYVTQKSLDTVKSAMKIWFFKSFLKYWEFRFTKKLIIILEKEKLIIK